MAECTTKITLCDDAFSVCGDVAISVNDMLSTDVSSLTSLKDFKDAISSELIDAKGWKTQSTYPTLRLLYERYMNSTDYCGPLSSQFDYCEMMDFSELVGTYWVDLIEQVVPSTTIWGSTYVYGNTLFDQQKFKYKKYSLHYCELPQYTDNVPSPTSGWTDTPEVEWSIVENNNYNAVSGSTTGQTFVNVTHQRPLSEKPVDPVSETCNGVGIIQTNCGSEFIGTISVVGETTDSETRRTFNSN